MPEPTQRLASTSTRISLRSAMTGLRSAQPEIDRRRNATPEDARIPFDFAHQVHFWKPLQHLVEGDLHFHPRQRRTEAEMDAVAEGKMRIGAAGDVEGLGIVELGGIAVRRPHQQ